jgi:hypothetical protein
MKIKFTKALTALAFAAVLVSCKKDKNSVQNPGNFILAVTPVASTGVAD